VSQQTNAELLNKDDPVRQGVVEQRRGSAQALQALPLQQSAPPAPKQDMAQTVTDEMEETSVTRLALDDFDGVVHEPQWPSALGIPEHIAQGFMRFYKRFANILVALSFFVIIMQFTNV
jgi:hypothetical protein